MSQNLRLLVTDSKVHRGQWCTFVTAPPCNRAWRYLWSGDQLIEETPIYADGTLATSQQIQWLYQPGEITPTTRYQQGKLHYVVTDHQGTPREIFSEGGQASWAGRLNTWGQMQFWRYREGKAENDPNYTECPFRFAGQYEDEESGLYYNRFRYYDKETGQYLSPDPIGLLGGLNPYGYVHCPTGWIDPLGLAGDCCNELKIVYGELDYLNRPTGVWARIDKSFINTGTHANPNIQPLGFITGQGSNRARGHLFGRQLGGSGDDVRNLVTLQQRPANTPFMSGIEGRIRKAAEQGQIIEMSSVPYYKGVSRIPAGITIKAEGTGGFYEYVTVLNPPGM